MIRTLVRFSPRPAPSCGPPIGPPARVRATGSAGALGALETGTPNEIGAPNEMGADGSGDPPFDSPPAALPPPKSIEKPANGSGLPPVVAASSFGPGGRLESSVIRAS